MVNEKPEEKGDVKDVCSVILYWILKLDVLRQYIKTRFDYLWTPDQETISPETLNQETDPETADLLLYQEVIGMNYDQ